MFLLPGRIAQAIVDAARKYDGVLATSDLEVGPHSISRVLNDFLTLDMYLSLGSSYAIR